MVQNYLLYCQQCRLATHSKSVEASPNAHVQSDPRGIFRMSLLIRINLALGVVFIAATLIAGYVCRSILEANAQREVFAEAGLLIDSAWASATTPKTRSCR